MKTGKILKKGVKDGEIMEPEPDCLSPQHVKSRLQEIIDAIKECKDIDVPESEIRELQHFFNERSMAFIQAARIELRQKEAAYYKFRGTYRRV